MSAITFSAHFRPLENPLDKTLFYLDLLNDEKITDLKIRFIASKVILETINENHFFPPSLIHPFIRIVTNLLNDPHLNTRQGASIRKNAAESLLLLHCCCDIPESAKTDLAFTLLQMTESSDLSYAQTPIALTILSQSLSLPENGLTYLTDALRNIIQSNDIDPNLASRLKLTAANEILLISKINFNPRPLKDHLAFALLVIIGSQDLSSTRSTSLQTKAAHAIQRLCRNCSFSELPIFLEIAWLEANRFLEETRIDRTLEIFSRLTERRDLYALWRDQRNTERLHQAQIQTPDTEIQTIFNQIQPLFPNKETFLDLSSEPSFILTFPSLFIAKIICSPKISSHCLPRFLSKDSRPLDEHPITEEQFTKIREKITAIHQTARGFAEPQKNSLYESIKNDQESTDVSVKEIALQIKGIVNELQQNPILIATMQKFLELAESFS
ncbi:MAG: hypothetical protein WCP39_05335 [Chlamydiota bacterium]